MWSRWESVWPRLSGRRAEGIRSCSVRLDEVLPVPAPAAINVLDVVALLVDMPEHGLVRGQVGTVVERLDEGVFEVEFSDDEGRTYAELALNECDLLVLHHRPVIAA